MADAHTPPVERAAGQPGPAAGPPPDPTPRNGQGGDEPRPAVEAPADRTKPRVRKAEDEDRARVVELELIEVRKTFTWIFKSMLAAILVSVILTLAGIFGVAVSKAVTPTATEKALIVQLIQVGYGMFLGIVCVFLGVMVSWLGITSAYALGAKGKSGTGGGDFSLKSSSPGIILMVGGIVLIALSLFKPIKYSETVPTTDAKIQSATPTG